MGKINERCAGIDVGKRFLLCSVLTGAAQDEPRSQTLRFDATVRSLIRLREWLIVEEVAHVVMESRAATRKQGSVLSVRDRHDCAFLASPRR